MLRRQPLITALDPQVVSSGLFFDVQDVLKPLWKTAQGVEFVDGKVRHRREDKKLLEPVEAFSRGLGQQFLSNQEKVLWACMGNDVLRWDQFSLQTMLTLPALSLNNPYLDFTFYGDWAFLNTGIGNVRFWNGLVFGTVAEMPTNVRQLRKVLSFLMAIGVGSKKTGVQWSDANDVSKWNPAADNSAGALYIDEFSSGIIAADNLGPVISVYSDSQMAVVSFIGAPFYFGQKVMLSGIGAVGAESVTGVGLWNYGVSRQGPWRTDGNDYQYIDKGRLQGYFQEEVNWDAGSKIIVARNDVLRTVEFYFPMRGSFEINEGWSFDPVTGGWSLIPPVSYFSEDMLFGLPLRADLVGEIALVGGRDFNRSPLLLQTKPMVGQVQTASGYTDLHFETKIDEIELLLHEVQNVSMRIGSSNDSAGTIRWSTPIPLVQGQATYKVPANVPDGIYWHLEFTSTLVLEGVVEGSEPVVEEGEPVVTLDPEDAWRFNLQGFLLYGAVEGGKG